MQFFVLLALLVEPALSDNPRQAQPGEGKVLATGLTDVDCARFSPDGRLLAIGGIKSGVELWDVTTRTKVHTFKGFAGPRATIAWSPDGRFLALGRVSDENEYLWSDEVWLYDVRTKKRLRTFRGTEFVVYGIAFSPDGKVLTMTSSVVEASGLLYLRAGGVLDLLDLASEKRQSLTTKTTGTTAFFQPTVGGRGTVLAVTVNVPQAVLLCDIGSGKELRRLNIDSGDSLWSLAISPDGTLLAVGMQEHGIRLWNVATGKEQPRLKGHKDLVDQVAFLPDGKTLASACLAEKSIKLWDLPAGQEIASLRLPEECRHTCAFSQDGKRCATVSKEGTLRLWDLTLLKGFPATKDREK